jgi:hypothetical protein
LAATEGAVMSRLVFFSLMGLAVALLIALCIDPDTVVDFMLGGME